MNFTTKTSLVGFLLALSTLIPDAATARPAEATTIESRLTRLSAALRERENQLDNSSETSQGPMAQGWANGNRGSWVNTGRRGWGDGRNRDWFNGRRGGWGDGWGGNWLNGNNWRNGWRDGGGFFNNRGGGGFLNRR